MENREIVIFWTDNSKRHLRKVYEFIALDSVYYAERFTTSMVKNVERQLLKAPTSGRFVPELQDSLYSHYREVIYKGYRIVYDPSKLSNRKIEIITIASGREYILNQLPKKSKI